MARTEKKDKLTRAKAELQKVARFSPIKFTRGVLR